MLLQSTFAFLGESLLLAGSVCLCTTQWCLCFSVLDLVKRLLTKVVRMSTVKGPQPNSTSAADRNKVTKSLVWMKSTFQCPGTHSQGSPNNSSRCPNGSPRGFSKTSLWRIFSNFLPQGGHRHWISYGLLCSKPPQGSFMGENLLYTHLKYIIA